MKKICLEIQYNGKNFCGWQTQPNGRSVQEVLEKRIEELIGERIKLFASGRTDSGVHAICQIAHFETNTDFIVEKLAKAVNFGLTDDVRVLKSYEVAHDFHARFNAKKKTYLYKIYDSEIRKPLKEGFAERVYKVDINLMKQAARYFLGRHNFKAFCAANTSVLDFSREIYKVDIKNIDDEIHIEICGNGFLYNMVRIMVGALVKVGEEKIEPQAIQDMLDSGVRCPLVKTMPPYGLYLKIVEYN